jgi:hypothetical protein
VEVFFHIFALGVPSLVLTLLVCRFIQLQYLYLNSIGTNTLSMDHNKMEIKVVAHICWHFDHAYFFSRDTYLTRKFVEKYILVQSLQYHILTLSLSTTLAYTFLYATVFLYLMLQVDVLLKHFTSVLVIFDSILTFRVKRRTHLPTDRTRWAMFEYEENHIFSVEGCISMDTIHFDLAELTNYLFYYS